MADFPTITSINAWQVPLTSHETYNMADGKTCDTVLTTVLRVDTDKSLCGWGEVCPIPHYLPAYADGVVPAIEEMAGQLIGHKVSAPEAMMARLDHWLPGHVYAKSAIDIALWDLFGKVTGQPLHALLGGRRAVDLPLYHSITCIEPDEMARIAKDAHDQGMRQFQVKLGVEQYWQKDAERLKAVRATVGDGPLVYGDWNCGATRLDAIRTSRAVADLDIMLEQPCATIEDCAAVKNACGLPMKMDELAHDTESLLKAWQLDCMDAVALKLSKFGGLSTMRRARDLCLHIGAKMCIECTWGSDIVTAAALHLGTSTDPARVLNVCDLSSYVAPHLDPNAPNRRDGTISIGDEPGLGVEPDITVLGSPIAAIN